MDRVIELKYTEKLQELIRLQEKVAHIHPLLQEHFPIVIVDNNQLNVFEFDKDRYYLSHIEPNTANIPIGIKAAFPLASVRNQVVVVVSEEVLDTISDQVIIFHEFVHCYQFQICEMRLRENINLARFSGNTSNYSWELDYEFPYTNEQYIENTRALFDSLDKNDNKSIHITRRKLKEALSSEQVEYMVWQEWKEGFARYIENEIKDYLGIAKNYGGRDEPYRRVTFYELGSQLISYIVQNFPNAHYKIEELYYHLNNDLIFEPNNI